LIVFIIYLTIKRENYEVMNFRFYTFFRRKFRLFYTGRPVKVGGGALKHLVGHRASKETQVEQQHFWFVLQKVPASVHGGAQVPVVAGCPFDPKHVSPGVQKFVLLHAPPCDT